MPFDSPVILGLKKTFGFGDRLGLAGPGHVAAAKNHDFAPVFAQQSVRELERTRRMPEEVLDAARKAVAQARYNRPWGADADHLKTPEDIRRMAAAGCTFFTFDPSAFVINGADTMSQNDLAAEISRQEQEGFYGGEKAEDLYLGNEYEPDTGRGLSFDRETLLRAAVKYGRAAAHCGALAEALASACPDRPFEIEISVDETSSPTSALEHLFFVLEMKRLGVVIVSLAPRFAGEFEKGTDYKGDLKQFETALEEHAAIARSFGPYKISVHSGSDKFSIYPALGRVCGELLHVKTAGTSYLEGLRVAARQAPELFKEIIRFSAEHFGEDKASYHISVTEEWVKGLNLDAASNLEGLFLDQDDGRQLLHVTFGSVLTAGRRPNGQTFKEALTEVLQTHKDLHHQLLENHLGKHLQLLTAG